MKDSRIGSFGVIALIASFGVRSAALYALLIAHGAAIACAAVIASAAVSRALMVWHWAQVPPARANGTAVAMGQPQQAAVRMALAIGLALSLPLLLAGVALGAAALALLASAAAAFVFSRYVSQKLGGHTGDTIGATQQITEMALLAALVIAL